MQASSEVKYIGTKTLMRTFRYANKYIQCILIIIQTLMTHAYCLVKYIYNVLIIIQTEQDKKKGFRLEAIIDNFIISV